MIALQVRCSDAGAWVDCGPYLSMPPYFWRARAHKDNLQAALAEAATRRPYPGACRRRCVACATALEAPWCERPPSGSCWNESASA